MERFISRPQHHTMHTAKAKYHYMKAYMFTQMNVQFMIFFGSTGWSEASNWEYEGQTATCILQLWLWTTFGQSGVFYSWGNGALLTSLMYSKSCGTGVVIIHNIRYVVVTMYSIYVNMNHEHWIIVVIIYIQCVFCSSLYYDSVRRIYFVHILLCIWNTPSLFAACHA